MTENPRDPLDGRLDSDADLDQSGADVATDDDYVDPIEQDVESISAPKPTTGPTALP